MKPWADVKPSDPQVRAAVAAGAFYPEEPQELADLVTRLLAASANATGVPSRAAWGVVVPHAGYEFSGGCAAEVFSRIQIPDTVVLIGPNHFGLGGTAASASVWRSGAFATPLGEVPVDEAFTATLLGRCPLVAHDPLAHRDDHALEVELPFLLVRAAPRRPAIVPILLRTDDAEVCRRLAGALAEVARARPPGGVLLLASSDMTHFVPADEALRGDGPALDAIGRLDGDGLLRVCRERGITMCGRAAAAVVVEAARQLGAQSAEVVAHTHSGVASGDYASVVSYAGVIIR